MLPSSIKSVIDLSVRTGSTGHLIGGDPVQLYEALAPRFFSMWAHDTPIEKRVAVYDSGVKHVTQHL